MSVRLECVVGWRAERRESRTVNTVIRKWCKSGEQRGADGTALLSQFPYISCPAGGLLHVALCLSTYCSAVSLL